MSTNGEISNNNIFNDIPMVPKCLQIRSVTKNLQPFNESIKFPDYRSAAHLFIWAPWEGCSVFGEYKAAVMMQMRFDGTFGFPGGMMDENEDILDGLNRELQEEISWDSTKDKITWNHYFNTRIDPSKKTCFHFFTIKMTMEDFVALEKRAHLAKDFGSEVFGSVRVPLYTMNNDFGGLPAFLNNRFVDAAKQLLLLALFHAQIFSEGELEEVIYKSQNMKLSASRI